MYTSLICITQDNRHFHSSLTKYKLAKCFFDREPCTITDSCARTHTGKIRDIQHEDGSGSSFNIQMESGLPFHVRTID